MMSATLSLDDVRDAAPESQIRFGVGPGSRQGCLLLFVADGRAGLYLHGTRAEFRALIDIIERKLALSPEAPRDGAADLDHGDHERDLGPEPAE